MAERMTSESWRVVRFSRYIILWSAEPAKIINQPVSVRQAGEKHSANFCFIPFHRLKIQKCFLQIYSETVLQFYFFFKSLLSF